MTANWYGNSLTGQYSATAARRIDWVTDTIKCSLHTATYSPAQDTDTYFSSAANELGAGNGYTAGGRAEGGPKTCTYDSGTNETRLDGDDAAWGPGATLTLRIAVVYKDTTVAGTSPLVGWVNFGADQSVTNGTFTIQWDSSGIAKITAA